MLRAGPGLQRQSCAHWEEAEFWVWAGTGSRRQGGSPVRTSESKASGSVGSASFWLAVKSQNVSVG